MCQIVYIPMFVFTYFHPFFIISHSLCLINFLNLFFFYFYSLHYHIVLCFDYCFKCFAIHAIFMHIFNFIVMYIGDFSKG